MWRNRSNGKGAILTCWEDVYHCLRLRRSPILSTAGWSCAHQYTGKRRGHVRETHLPWTFRVRTLHQGIRRSPLSLWSATHTRACFSPIAVGSVFVTTIPSVHSTCSPVAISHFYFILTCSVSLSVHTSNPGNRTELHCFENELNFNAQKNIPALLYERLTPQLQSCGASSSWILHPYLCKSSVAFDFITLHILSSACAEKTCVPLLSSSLKKKCVSRDNLSHVYSAGCTLLLGCWVVCFFLVFLD